MEAVGLRHQQAAQPRRRPRCGAHQNGHWHGRFHAVDVIGLSDECGLLGKAPLPEELRGALGISDDDEDAAAIDADNDGEGDGEYAGIGLVEE
jgi:hypothetical protein